MASQGPLADRRRRQADAAARRRYPTAAVRHAHLLWRRGGIRAGRGRPSRRAPRRPFAPYPGCRTPVGHCVVTKRRHPRVAARIIRARRRRDRVGRGSRRGGSTGYVRVFRLAHA